MDFEVQRFTRRCAVTDQELGPGETFYSMLVCEGADVIRRDFSEAAWKGPTDDAIGWWQATVPSLDGVRQHWAPNDVMLHMFQQLSDDPQNADLRYLLTLLLIRRRVLRLQASQPDERGQEWLIVHSAKLETPLKVAVVAPTQERKGAIQEYLARLVLERAA